MHYKCLEFSLILMLLTTLLLTLLTTCFRFGRWKYTLFVFTNQNHCYMPKLNDKGISSPSVKSLHYFLCYFHRIFMPFFHNPLIFLFRRVIFQTLMPLGNKDGNILYLDPLTYKAMSVIFILILFTVPSLDSMGLSVFESRVYKLWDSDIPNGIPNNWYA